MKSIKVLIKEVKYKDDKEVGVKPFDSWVADVSFEGDLTSANLKELVAEQVLNVSEYKSLGITKVRDEVYHRSKPSVLEDATVVNDIVYLDYNIYVTFSKK